ncbi:MULTISPECIES: DUF2281 domain-containing protein [Nostocales]|nr:DUF2281 domain-containing protein [Tolypothrix bouteillei]KAF3883793.1 DUF2281 domain-containing protein [Tolypothrix bouteillei VB521301]
MNTAQKIYELVKAMPEEQANEVLDFVEFIRHKATLKLGSEQLSKIPKGTLTGLRGIAKRAGSTPTDTEVQEEYTDYLIQKYQ